MIQEHCSSRAIAPDRWVIPLPSPRTVAMLHNIKRNTSPFLRAAGIRGGSKEHKQLKTTIQALHRRYLDPFKYLEEQLPASVDNLIEKARITLPWLDKYEDSWPARIYLKRYVDARRPHLLCTIQAHPRRIRARKSTASCAIPTKNPSDVPGNHASVVRDFLGSLAPSLERHLDAFVELGIKDLETLRAFLSWPHNIQTQFLDEGNEVLQLTSLERKGLSVGCGLLAQRVLQESLLRIVEPVNFCR